MNKHKLLERLMHSRKNVKFNDFLLLLEAYGFRHMRVQGSHNIYKNESVAEIINIQSVNGEVKPYQIKQFPAVIEKYNLQMEGEK